MDARDTYLFHIDGWTPKTLPMSRLAEYLAELAKLMGETERVHFEKLKRGSAVASVLVERPAAPKVRRRVVQAKSMEAPDDIRRPFDNLNELLRADNAKGDLKVGNAKILKFPGRDIPLAERIGPFKEHTEIDGILVRIGGTDNTAHAHIEDTDGRSWLCVLSRDQARTLAPYLYGAPLRVSGTGRWARNEFSKWELVSPMKLETFTVLKAEDLPATVERLRSIQGSSWKGEKDPLRLLAKIRDGGEGVH